VDGEDKPLVWLHGEIKTPPFSAEARSEAGFMLRRIQGGESLEMPHSRPMTSIGSNCHELRIKDETKNWRIFYYLDDDAIVILEVHNKTTQKTPDYVIETCSKRLAAYKQAIKGTKKGDKS